MQNAMDIMAMVQKSSLTAKPRADVLSRPLAGEGNRFERELSEAKKGMYSGKQANPQNKPSTTTSTIENKNNLLARVMSGNNAKSEAKSDAMVDKMEQGIDTGQADTDVRTIEADLIEELESNTEVEEAAQPLLEMLQQLLQQLQGMQINESENPELAETQAAMKDLIEKLEAMLTKPIANQAIEVGKLVRSLELELSKLGKQLNLTPEQQTDLQQPKKIIEQLVKSLLNEIPKVQQELSSIDNDEKAMPEHSLQLNGVKNKDIQSTDTKQAEGTPQNIEGASETPKKWEESRQQEEEADSSYKTEGEVKSPQKTDKPEVDMKVENAPIHVEAQNPQIQVKNLQAANQKLTQVHISKSDIINQVVKKADIIVQNGHQEMIMKLEPESLGKLNLKISVENGIITAKFIAESQQVKEVLESSFNQLKDALQEKGISVQSLSVSVGQQGAEFNSSQSFDQWKRSIKLNRNSVGYEGLDEELTAHINPYNYHDGKVDFRA